MNSIYGHLPTNDPSIVEDQVGGAMHALKDSKTRIATACIAGIAIAVLSGARWGSLMMTVITPASIAWGTVAETVVKEQHVAKLTLMALAALTVGVALRALAAIAEKKAEEAGLVVGPGTTLLAKLVTVTVVVAASAKAVLKAAEAAVDARLIGRILLVEGLVLGVLGVSLSMKLEEALQDQVGLSETASSLISSPLMVMGGLAPFMYTEGLRFPWTVMKLTVIAAGNLVMGKREPLSQV